MASAAVRALAKVRTPRVTLEQLTGEVADRRRAGAYLHNVLPPLLARMAVSLEDGAPASLAGLPAVSVPFGTTGGLPVGVQVVGRAFDDAGVLRVARRLELARDGALL